MTIELDSRLHWNDGSIMITTKSYRVCIAPMLNYTDRHFRYFIRLISKHIFLYTEMVSTGALLCGDAERFLQFHEWEHPVALQLGGNDPKDLAKCAKLVESFGYDEINLNIGCPSSRVQSGQFGVCLMLQPQLVADCVRAMQDAVSIPVTVKTRIGVDQQDSYESLTNFVDLVSSGGCQNFIIHARKAILKNISPKANRTISPLHYDVVYQLKKDFPNLEIIINGGIKSLDDIREHLKYVDGVMIGREAYHNPYFLAEVDSTFFDDNHPIPSRQAIAEQYQLYVDQQLKKGVSRTQVIRPMMGLFKGQKGAKAWRRS